MVTAPSGLALAALSAGLLVCCAPEFVFDNVCDPKNNRLDECVPDGGLGDALPFGSSCDDREIPCNGIDDDCNAETRDEDVEGYVCQRPGAFVFSREGMSTELSISLYLLVGASEATCRDWRAYRGTTEGTEAIDACSPGAECADDNCPVVGVSFADVARYANWRSTQENGLEPCYEIDDDDRLRGGERVTFAGVVCTGYRLPTEAEWLYIAQSRYGDIVGGATLDDVGRFAPEDGEGCTVASVERVAAPRDEVDGIRDLLGNAGEWTMDAYYDPADPTDDLCGASAPTFESTVDPLHSPPGDEGVEPQRIVRGASACHRPLSAACALKWREAWNPYESSPAIGFRLVRTMAVSTPE